METTNQLYIRQETLNDSKDVYEINCRAFEREAEAILVRKLKETSAWIPELCLIALENNKAVGYVAFSRVKILGYRKNRVFDSIALSPMAVLPEYQRRGIGGLLVAQGLQRAKELEFESVFVLGHKSYYTKFGFKPARLWSIKTLFPVSEKGDFMAVELKKNSLKKVNGIIEFSGPFYDK